MTGVRKDGNGQTNINIYKECLSPQYWAIVNGERVCMSPNDPDNIGGKRCEKLIKQQHIEHGRHIITFTPGDTCGAGTPKNLAWDVDLPDTFEAQDFPKSEYWFKNLKAPDYPIKTVVPAKTPAGKFPKHYTVDCDEKYINNETRDDGNGGELTCALITSFNHQNNGCNPASIGAKYYHVCGGTGQCKKSKWAVFAPQSESCKNVPCDPNGLLCCQSTTYCGSSYHKCLMKSSSPLRCSRPKDGSNQGNQSQSGCPPLGLYDCNYTVTCDDGSSCGNKRSGKACTYTETINGSCNSNTCSPGGTFCNYDYECYTTSAKLGTCITQPGGRCTEKSQPNNPQYDKCSVRQPCP